MSRDEVISVQIGLEMLVSHGRLMEVGSVDGAELAAWPASP